MFLYRVTNNKHFLKCNRRSKFSRSFSGVCEMKTVSITVPCCRNFTAYLCAVVWTLQRILTVAAQTQAPAIEQTNILWSLSPCQSAFWVPSIPSEFNQNWITYQYEGNPLSQAGKMLIILVFREIMGRRVTCLKRRNKNFRFIGN